MITFTLMKESGVLVISPEGKLEPQDFAAVAAEVDPFIEERGGLPGLMISAETFPGWDSFEALLTHIRFVRDHHRKIGRVALVSDGKLLSRVPRLADYFVSAEVRHFVTEDREGAMQWLEEGGR